MTSEVENTSKKNKQQQEDIAFLYDLMQTSKQNNQEYFQLIVLFLSAGICVESWLACDEVVDESAVDELVAINWLADRQTTRSLVYTIIARPFSINPTFC